MVEKVIKHMPFLIISFFEKVQVSPELYGDTRPRFFIYWTVKQKKKMWFGLFIYIVLVFVITLLIFEWLGVAD